MKTTTTTTAATTMSELTAGERTCNPILCRGCGVQLSSRTPVQSAIADGFTCSYRIVLSGLRNLLTAEFVWDICFLLR